MVGPQNRGAAGAGGHGGDVLAPASRPPGRSARPDRSRQGSEPPVGQDDPAGYRRPDPVGESIGERLPGIARRHRHSRWTACRHASKPIIRRPTGQNTTLPGTAASELASYGVGSADNQDRSAGVMHQPGRDRPSSSRWATECPRAPTTMRSAPCSSADSCAGSPGRRCAPRTARSADSVERRCGPLAGQPLQLLPVAIQVDAGAERRHRGWRSCRTYTAVSLASRSAASRPASVTASALASDPSPPPGCARRRPWEHLFCRDGSLQLRFSQTRGSSRADRPGRPRRMGPMATSGAVPSALPGPGRLTECGEGRARRSRRTTPRG